MLLFERPHLGGGAGVQKVYKFKNGYGASVVNSPFTLSGANGLWKLAVLKFTSENQYELTYKTPITSDVEPFLTWEKVEELLKKIEALEPDKY